MRQNATTGLLEMVHHSDIGNPRLKGSVRTTQGEFDVTAAGADIWGTRDECHFVYAERQGDFDVRARIVDLTYADLYTKAGIMARESLAEGSRHVYFQVFPDNSDRNSNNGGFEYQYRQESGGDMKAIYPHSHQGEAPFPVTYPNTWLGLSRRHNLFSGYYSSDGQHWQLYGALEIALPEILILGMAVTAHNPDKLATARFRDITGFQ